ncbi:MAG: hypothetical protein ACK5QX_00270 [bacterium]|jgi:hypothetical protein
MARYKVLQMSFVGNRLAQEGEIVEIDDSEVTPGANLAKVDQDDEPEATRPARKGKKGTDESGADLA